MRVLVTGGAGFIGSHVVDAFLGAGIEAAALDDLSTGRRENLPRDVPLYQVDLRQRDAVLEAFKDWRPTHVCHHAAQASVTASVRDPARDATINVLGGIHTLEACAATGVEGFVYASTGGAVYGEVPEDSRGADETWPLLPLSPYGASKAAVELYVRAWEREHSIPAVILRYANVYGPRQDPRGEAGVVAVFASRLQAGEPVTLNARRTPGDGGCLRDYVHVSDVARANRMALEGRLGWGVGEGAVYNIGTGEPRRTSDVLASIAKAVGTEPTVTQAGPRPGDLEVSFLNVDRARTRGWQPQVGFDDGIRDVTRWTGDHAAAPKR